MRRALIIFLGAIPATLVMSYVALLLVDDASSLFALPGLWPFIFIVWGLAGSWGTISPWDAALNPPAFQYVPGLFIGVIAAIPILLEFGVNWLIPGVLLGPLVIAIFLSFEWYRSFNRGAP